MIRHSGDLGKHAHGVATVGPNAPAWSQQRIVAAPARYGVQVMKMRQVTIKAGNLATGGLCVTDCT